MSAISRAEAIKHPTANRFSAAVATQADLVQLIGDGMRVEIARNPELPTKRWARRYDRL